MRVETHCELAFAMLAIVTAAFLAFKLAAIAAHPHAQPKSIPNRRVTMDFMVERSQHLPYFDCDRIDCDDRDTVRISCHSP